MITSEVASASTGIWMGADINLNHGPHGQFALLEGNIVGKIMSDGFHGSSSHATNEVKRLLKAALTYRDGEMASVIAIGLFAGIRPSEIQDLKPTNVRDDRIRLPKPTAGQVDENLRLMGKYPAVYSRGSTLGARCCAAPRLQSLLKNPRQVPTGAALKEEVISREELQSKVTFRLFPPGCNGFFPDHRIIPPAERFDRAIQRFFRFTDVGLE